VIGPDAASLAGKVALVTGAARGIGQGAAYALASFGADVAICDRDVEGMRETAATIEGLGRRCVTGLLDVRDTDAVDAWVDGLSSSFDHVDVLVNNAGGGFHAAFVDTNLKGQRSLVDENFTSVTSFVRACLPKIPEGGSIINVTSIEASRAAPGFGIYAAMKAAVENLTKTLALELAPRGIRVNVIAPDAIPTPGDHDLAEASSQGAREAYGAKVPLGWGEIDDCAGPIVFLASELSRYVTGTVLHVDGGSHAASGWVRQPDGTYTP
jgi:NAD(P)-dependent dehydrogenase (short-subunit alcohol dehydrogenase family)